MADLDVPLLERVLVDWAAGESREVLAREITTLLTGPDTTLSACTGVIVCIVKVANDSGLVPASRSDEEVFYGFDMSIRDYLADGTTPDEYMPARVAAMQALVCAFNNDYPTAFELLRAPLEHSKITALVAFQQLLQAWKALVNTTEGALAVQLLGLGDDDAP